MGFMIFATTITVILFIKDRRKTIQGLKKGFKKLLNIIPVFLFMLVLVAVALTLMPEDLISKHLTSGDRYLGTLLGLGFGSVAVMPGFVAFPLGSILRDQGVHYMVIAAFTCSLMMVGIMTFPVEKQFFGTRFAILRNVSSVIICMIIALIMGLVFGEIL